MIRLRGYVPEENLLIYPLSGQDVYIDKYGNLRGTYWPKPYNDPENTKYCEIKFDKDTGFVDKNNNSIFENDLVQFESGDAPYLVNWNEFMGTWVVSSDCGGGEATLYKVWSRIVIVGNVHTGKTKYNEPISDRNKVFCLLCNSWNCKKPDEHYLENWVYF